MTAPLIGVVVNPVARFHREFPNASARLAQLIEGRGLFEESQDLSAIPLIAKRFKEAGVEILAISGGDGTTSHTLTGFRKIYGEAALPKLVLLRGGTMNTAANGIGTAPGRPEQVLGRLLASLDRGEEPEVKTMPTLDMNGQLGFITGVGVIPAFLKVYYEAGRPYPTIWIAFKLLTKTVLSALVGGKLAKRVADRVSCNVQVDGQPWPASSYLTVGAATVPQVGFGFAPFHRCREDLSRFHVVGFTCSKYGLIWALRHIIRAKPTSPKITLQALAQEVHIQQDPGPTLYTIDGEVLEAEDLHITLGPQLDVILG